MVASAGLMAWRWRRFESHDQVESLLSRDFLYYLTNLLLTLFAIAIAFGTVVVPLVFDRTVGLDTYNAIAQPLGVVVLALIAVCPLLAWRKTEGAELRKTLILPLVTAVLSVPLWLYLGFQSNVWGFIGLVVCGFAVGAVIQFVLRSARRAAGPGKSLWAGMGRAFTGSRTRTAAYFVHFGMILVVAGLIGSSVYKQEETALVKVKAGETASIAGYTLTYKGMEGSTGPQNSTTSIATFDVSRDGDADRHADAAHRRLSHERGGGTRRDPRAAVRGPLRGRRRAVRRHLEAHRVAHGHLPAHPLGVDRLHPAVRGRRRIALAQGAPPGAGGARGRPGRRRRRAPGRRLGLAEGARCRTHQTGRTA